MKGFKQTQFLMKGESYNQSSRGLYRLVTPITQSVDKVYNTTRTPAITQMAIIRRCIGNNL